MEDSSVASPVSREVDLLVCDAAAAAAAPPAPMPPMPPIGIMPIPPPAPPPPAAPPPIAGAAAPPEVRVVTSPPPESLVSEVLTSAWIPDWSAVNSPDSVVVGPSDVPAGADCATGSASGDPPPELAAGAFGLGAAGCS